MISYFLISITEMSLESRILDITVPMSFLVKTEMHVVDSAFTPSAISSWAPVHVVLIAAGREIINILEILEYWRTSVFKFQILFPLNVLSGFSFLGL